MQLAKNLYLNPSKNPLRKAKEIVIAWQIEQALSKRRIFEIYLNVVEWGPNVYGAEAAARYYFAKPAVNLDIPKRRHSPRYSQAHAILVKKISPTEEISS